MLKIAAYRVGCLGSVEISLLFPRSRTLLCFHSTLSAYEAKPKWWWEENSGNHSGPDQAPANKWRLACHLPVILISPAFTRAHKNKPPCFCAHHAFTWDFLTIVVKQAVNKGDPLLHRLPPSSAVVICACTAAEEPRRNNADTLNILSMLTFVHLGADKVED